jgi:hypothetical protein
MVTKATLAMIMCVHSGESFNVVATMSEKIERATSTAGSELAQSGVVVTVRSTEPEAEPCNQTCR